MIRPIGVQNADLGHGRVSLLLFFKVLLDVQEILECHSQVEGIIEFLKRLFAHTPESFHNLYILRLLKLHHKSIRFFFRGLSGIHRIDAVIFDLSHLILRQCSLYYICSGTSDDRFLTFI